MIDKKIKHQLVEFSKLYGYSQKLRSRYLVLISANKIFQRLEELASINNVGKKRATANVKVLNTYKYFFLGTKEATRCYVLIELAKFFDESSESLTLVNSLGYAEKHIESYSLEVFKEFHKNRNRVLLEGYKPFVVKDIERLKKRVKNNEIRIKKLKTYRDQYLAHDDVKKKEINLGRSDVRILMTLVKDTIELLYNSLDCSGTIYDNFEETPIHEIDHMFASLIEHEQYRLSR